VLNGSLAGGNLGGQFWRGGGQGTNTLKKNRNPTRKSKARGWNFKNWGESGGRSSMQKTKGKPPPQTTSHRKKERKNVCYTFNEVVRRSFEERRRGEVIDKQK